MSADLARDLIDGLVPVRNFVAAGLQAEGSERFGGRAAIAEDASAGLTADGQGLMPLDRIDVVGEGRMSHGLATLATDTYALHRDAALTALVNGADGILETQRTL